MIVHDNNYLLVCWKYHLVGYFASHGQNGVSVDSAWSRHDAKLFDCQHKTTTTLVLKKIENSMIHTVPRLSSRAIISTLTNINHIYWA